MGKRPQDLGNLDFSGHSEPAGHFNWGMGDAEASGSQNDKDMIGLLKTRSHTQPVAGCSSSSSIENLDLIHMLKSFGPHCLGREPGPYFH